MPVPPAGASAAFTIATRRTTDGAPSGWRAGWSSFRVVGLVRMRETLRFSGETTTVVVTKDGIRR